MAFLNRCIWTATASGLVDFVVSAAAQNGYTPAQCLAPGAVDGATYHYFAANGSDHEEGDGVYTAATKTLTRSSIRNSSNGGSKVNFTTAPAVFMGGPDAQDMGSPAIGKTVIGGTAGRTLVVDPSGNIGQGYATPYNVKYPNYPGAGAGAVGDGITDDTAAITAVVRAAYAAAVGLVGPSIIFFPAGLYRIAGDNPLGNIITANASATGNAVGLYFVGEGKFNSVLRMDTSGASSARYIFNTPSGFTTTQGSVFMDIGFQGGAPDSDGAWAFSSIPTFANGFKISGTNSPAVQNGNIDFVRCAVAGVQTAFEFDGDAVASEMSHQDCSYSYIGTALYYINNGQSVNHRFFGTDAAPVYGDVVKLGSNGGGSLQFFSGSIIMSPDGTSTNRWLLNVPVAIGCDPIEFYSMRLELRGNFSNLINIANTTNIRVVLHGGRILDEASAAKTHWLQLGDDSRVDITETTLNQSGGFATNVALFGTGLGGEVGTVLFDKCSLPADFSDQCSVNFVGCITAIRCQGNVGQSGTAYTANDFTLNGLANLGQFTAWNGAGKVGDGGTACLQPTPKWAYIKCWPDGWPTSLGAEQTLKLPQGAVIKSIHVLYAGGGLANFTTNPTFLRVTNNDYSVLHAAVTVGNGSTAAQIHLNDYFYAVNTAVKDRTLRLSFGPNSASASVYTGVTGSNGGGVALVEYF